MNCDLHECVQPDQPWKYESRHMYYTSLSVTFLHTSLKSGNGVCCIFTVVIDWKRIFDGGVASQIFGVKFKGSYTISAGKYGCERGKILLRLKISESLGDDPHMSV